MVAIDPEMMSQGEVESPLQSDHHQQPKTAAEFQPLGRQSSIYSLTLDEFQHTLCESGKNFGSMNMDEFLNSIWTAEENQAQAHSSNNTPVDNNNYGNTHQYPMAEGGPEKGIPRQLSLSRQGSLSLPAPLCRKTVEEVWSEIQKSTQQGQQQHDDSVQRQATFGEMTLEDFLVRAGVVREQCQPPLPPPPQQAYGFSPGPSFVSRPIMGLGQGVASAGPAPFPAMPPCGIGGEYGGTGKRGGGGYPQLHYGGRAGGGGGYGAVQGLGMGSPVSPVSSDGICGNQLDGGNQYGMDVGNKGGGGGGGRKRIMDGPVEKVVERRQRRMIKNRESAARSRARKQAYTVELEAELNQLKEENAHLRQALAELERKRKQQFFEEMEARARTKAGKAREKLRGMRRNLSCPY